MCKVGGAIQGVHAPQVLAVGVACGGREGEEHRIGGVGGCG